MQKNQIECGTVSKNVLIVNIIATIFYISWWLNPEHIGNPALFALLFIGEIYHVSMSLMFWHTIWPSKEKNRARIDNTEYEPSVDVYITVTGEPVEIARETALAAKNLSYRNHTVYLLNDGYVAKKSNWQDIEKLAQELNIQCITRKIPGGAKAGNINNALKITTGEYIAIFDTDMVPHNNFLKKTIPYFQDSSIGFVQTPQYYKNHEYNTISGASWEQQEVFFGAILNGKNRNNAAFICGTNVVIKKSALLEVGGMCEDNIAEDFLTSLFIHQKGWKSHYVPEVLAEGLAPEDALSYYKQQLRWSRGSLEVVFSHNPIFKKGLTVRQKIEYLSSGLYYCNGAIILIDALMPIFSLIGNVQPVSASTTSFAFFFLPFLTLNLYTLYKATNGSVTLRSQAFSMSLWVIQLKALAAVLLKQKTSFAVTPKHAQSGNFLFLAYPHLAYIGLVIVAITIGLHREGFTPSVATNITWCLFNISMFIPFVLATLDTKQLIFSLSKVKQREIISQT